MNREELRKDQAFTQQPVNMILFEDQLFIAMKTHIVELNFKVVSDLLEAQGDTRSVIDLTPMEFHE